MIAEDASKAVMTSTVAVVVTVITRTHVCMYENIGRTYTTYLLPVVV